MRSRLAGLHVLVVDDAPYVLAVVTDSLEQDGARVTAVTRAEDALDALRRERPHVLLSDLTMPGHDGYWLIAQVRALSPERGGATPAAALTALATAEDRASVLRAGFQVHLEKPVALDALVDVVEALGHLDGTRGVDVAASGR
jgi:CheY-like chemotaxis protein